MDKPAFLHDDGVVRDYPQKKTSAALMVERRSKYEEHFDDFPTPPWATRALVKYAIGKDVIRGKEILEPACGRGHMVKTLNEYGPRILRFSDIDTYDGYGKYPPTDYVSTSVKFPADWIITNPPFKLAEAFARKALSEARYGVAFILRTLWLDPGAKRFRFFKEFPPTAVFVYAGRMDAAKGKVVQKNGSFMSHSVFVWDIRNPCKIGNTKLGWIPHEAQQKLERPDDYDDDWVKK